MRDIIFNKLEEYLDIAAEKGISGDSILGIFLYGSQNYGMGKKSSDVDAKIIYVPSFEEICLKKEWKSQEIIVADSGHIDIKDIRLMREMWQKQNINFMEILFTDYFILNPKYESLFNELFVENRDIIAHYDRKKTVKSIGGQVQATLKGELTPKKIYNATRLYYFLMDYLGGKPYADCIKPTGDIHNYLWGIKYAEEMSEFEMNAKATMLMGAFDMLMQNAEDLASPDQKAATAALDFGVCEILRYAFAKESISKKEFVDSLTNTEVKALNSIYTEIQAEGNFALSKMVEKFSISRPVYQNLLNKLKEYSIAEVASQGMKGTYVKFMHPEFRMEAESYK